MLKENRGVTLVALVVTIIVLLILAGVSIAMITGEGGILTEAKNAETSNNKGSLIEAAKLAVSEITMNNATPGKTDVEYSIGNIAEYAQDYVAAGLTVSGSESTLTLKNGDEALATCTVVFSADGKTVTGIS